MTLSFFVLNLFNALAMVYATSKLLETKIYFKNKKIYVVVLVLAIYTFFTYLITKSILRIIVLFQISTACYIYLFRSEENNIQKITFVSLFGSILLLLSEVVFVIFINIFFSMFININEMNAYTNNIISYIIIFFFLILMNIKPFTRVLIKFIKSPYVVKSYKFLFFVMYIFIILTTIVYLIYFDLSQTLKFILLVLVLAEYIYLASSIIISYKNKDKIQKELELMLEITSKYEALINDSRIKNHENNNQLIVIKDLIGNDNKKATSYIDSMLKSNYNDDDETALKVSSIPTGGLKGLLYYKLLTMKSKNIYCYIDTAKNINKKIFDKINIEPLQSFYKIIGVFLDNAIEAVENNNKKQILIQLYKEKEYLIFSVSNEYHKELDFDVLGKIKFTTKGENHGYGLQLVKELVDSHSEIFNQTEVKGNLFVQKVGIKIKG